MDLHVKVLAVLHIVLGVLGLLGALVVMLVFGGLAGTVGIAAATEDPDAWIAVPILGLIGGVVMLLIIILSIPGIIAGFGLLKYRPWARILTIILSALNLFNLPFGTLLGIYGLWVLLQQETTQLFDGSPAVTGGTPPLPPAVTS